MDLDLDGLRLSPWRWAMRDVGRRAMSWSKPVLSAAVLAVMAQFFGDWTPLERFGVFAAVVSAVLVIAGAVLPPIEQNRLLKQKLHEVHGRHIWDLDLGALKFRAEADRIEARLVKFEEAIQRGDTTEAIENLPVLAMSDLVGCRATLEAFGQPFDEFIFMRDPKKTIGSLRHAARHLESGSHCFMGIVL